ncbi:hypothetical protein RB628_24285, partial [Streptomyces sp. ADMS]
MGPERGKVNAAVRARVAKARGSEPRGPEPASSALFPDPVAGEVLAVLAPEQAGDTIADPARARAPAMGTGTAPVTGTAAGRAAVLAASTATD